MIKTLLEILFGLFCVLQVADIATTMTVLNRGGHELNPFLARLMSGIGALPAMILAKGLIIAVLAVVIWYAYVRSNQLQYGIVALALLDAFYVFIVARNIRQA